MPRDLTKIEMDDRPEPDSRRLTGARGMDKVAPMAPMGRSPVNPNPADAGIFTADKGIQPPSPDEGPTVDRGMRRPIRKKCGGSVKKMKSGGSTSSASKRADGIAIKGKTRGKIC